MFLKKRLTACAAVIAALAVGASGASAGAATASRADRGSPRCPDWYVGPTNLATGCPWWLMS